MEENTDKLLDLPLQFGPTINFLRHKAGIPQTQLAKRARVSSSTINKIEAGNEVPSRDTVIRIADALSYPGHQEYFLILLSAGYFPPGKEGRRLLLQLGFGDKTKWDKLWTDPD